MSSHDAISQAVMTLNAHGQYHAAKVLLQILRQRGCEELDPACDTLTDLIDVVLDG